MKRASAKRRAPDSPREAIRRILQDGEWHRAGDILLKVYALVPSHIAVRKYLSNARRRGREDTVLPSQDVQITQGATWVVFSILSNLKAERRGPPGMNREWRMPRQQEGP